MKTEDLIEDLSGNLKTTKTENIYVHMARWIIFFIFISSLVFLLRGIRPDIEQQMTYSYFKNEMALSIITAFLSYFLALKLAIPDDNRKNIINLLPLIPIFLMGYIIYSGGEINSEALKESLAGNHFEITALLFLYTIPLALYGFIKVKKLCPTLPKMNGFLIALSAAAGSHFIVRISEMAENIAPVFVWCYLPIVLFGLIGVFFGSKFLKW